MVTKLSKRQKTNIAKAYGKKSPEELAKQYKVSVSTINRVWADHKDEREGKPEEPAVETGIWLSVMENGEQKQIQVIRFEGRKKILTEDGAKYVTKQARSGCIAEEIASMLGVDYDTLTNDINNDNFRSAYKKGYDECNSRLRKAQIQSALDGNATLQVWLGKVRLGQTDQIKEVVSSVLDEYLKAMTEGKT